MVNACTPQGEPILGTGGEKKRKKLDYVHWFCMRCISHLAKGVKIFKKCSPMMVAFCFVQPWSQTLVSTESLDLIVPGVRSPAQGSVSDRWIPSDANFPVLLTHTVWPRFQSSCLCEGSCPIVPVMENFMPFEGPVGVWWRCYNWPTMFPKKDVKCTKLFLVQGTVTTSKTDPCWHASIEVFQPRICRSLSRSFPCRFGTMPLSQIQLEALKKPSDHHSNPTRQSQKTWQQSIRKIWSLQDSNHHRRCNKQRCQLARFDHRFRKGIFEDSRPHACGCCGTRKYKTRSSSRNPRPRSRCEEQNAFQCRHGS